MEGTLMASIILRGNQLTVDTYTDLVAIPVSKRRYGLQVVVKDATLDNRTLGGVATYIWNDSKIGTVDEWTVLNQENENLVTMVQESILISSGKATITDQPANGFLVSAIVTWEENGTKFVEDIIYTLSNKDIILDPIYNGKNLDVKYLVNTGGKVYVMTSLLPSSALVTEIVGSNVTKTMAVGTRYIVNAGVVLKTPATASNINDTIEIVSYNSTVNDTIVEINTGLPTFINAENFDIQLDTSDFYVKLVYVDSTVGWRLIVN